MGDWSQKADADTGKTMSDKPAGKAVQPCEQGHKIEPVLKPPEEVALTSSVKVEELHEVKPGHTVEPDQQMKTGHTIAKDES